MWRLEPFSDQKNRNWIPSYVFDRLNVFIFSYLRLSMESPFLCALGNRTVCALFSIWLFFYASFVERAQSKQHTQTHKGKLMNKNEALSSFYCHLFHLILAYNFKIIFISFLCYVYVWFLYLPIFFSLLSLLLLLLLLLFVYLCFAVLFGWWTKGIIERRSREIEKILTVANVNLTHLKWNNNNVHCTLTQAKQQSQFMSIAFDWTSIRNVMNCAMQFCAGRKFGTQWN